MPLLWSSIRCIFQNAQHCERSLNCLDQKPNQTKPNNKTTTQTKNPDFSLQKIPSKMKSILQKFSSSHPGLATGQLFPLASRFQHTLKIHHYKIFAGLCQTWGKLTRFSRHNGKQSSIKRNVVWLFPMCPGFPMCSTGIKTLIPKQHGMLKTSLLFQTSGRNQHGGLGMTIYPRAVVESSWTPVSSKGQAKGTQ